MAIYDADDNMLMRFQYADSRLPVTMQSGGATYCLAYDQVGSLRIVTDATGTVIKALDYDSFGNIIQDTNPNFDMPFGFAAGLYDPDTGFVRFGFREYSPEIGRWPAKDPILFLGGDTDLYGYCLDDPINWIDPYGLYSFDEGLQDASNLFAGFGDTLTFGATAWVRNQWNQAAGLSDVVNECSGFFKAGEWGAFAWDVAMGGAGGLAKSGAKTAGKEFSHWIPRRLGGPRSPFNGNYVSSARHYFHDPFRYPSGWQNLGNKWNPLLQQLDRIPNVYKGAGLGAGAGAAGMAVNNCGCQ